LDLKNSTVYDDKFYEKIKNNSGKCAVLMLPTIQKILPKLETMVDFGCGVGTWLEAAKQLFGVSILGIDGDYAIPNLVIDKSEFVPCDFNTTMPSGIDKKDLAISLEVGEHLNKDRAKPFVDAICQTSDYILFGAATPGQKGTHHVNEQPQSYWAKMFIDNGYIPVDFRMKVILNYKISYWYRQNALLYVKSLKDINLDYLDILIRDKYEIRHFKGFDPKLNKGFDFNSED
jgi:cyclopropane fatty-acyl-phospholipid synthase-like methyltransferase